MSKTPLRASDACRFKVGNDCCFVVMVVVVVCALLSIEVASSNLLLLEVFCDELVAACVVLALDGVDEDDEE